MLQNSEFLGFVVGVGKVFVLVAGDAASQGILFPTNRDKVELVRNMMAHAQKPHFVFRLNGRIHLNRRRSQFSRLLAAEVCVSALVMLDTPPSEVVWEYWLPTPFASFPFTSSPVRHRVPPHSERSILKSSPSAEISLLVDFDSWRWDCYVASTRRECITP